MDIKAIALATVLGIAGGFGASYLTMQHELTDVHASLDRVRPTVVVDFGKIALSYSDTDDQDELDRRMAKTNAAILKLRDAGYVVLDASSVAAAPESAYLPADLVKDMTLP